MILKASQRGGGKQLALHLLKTEENEHVEIHEVRGFIAEDVVGAFKEAHATAKGTRCRQYLFSVSLSPPPKEAVRPEVFEAAIAKIEERTGLTGQPRVIVFHEKEGRRHAHAVWSRIDAAEMKAVQLSHFKTKLREVSKELYLEHGWKMPGGLADSKERDPKNFSLDEWQQAKRIGADPKALKSIVQECWAISDSKAAFSAALEARGLYLARGDRRGHVALTFEGEPLSIARMLGKKSKEVEDRLGDPSTSRSVEEAKSYIGAQIAPRLHGLIQEAQRARMNEVSPLDRQRLALRDQHRQERERLEAAQKQRLEEETRARAAKLRKGALGVWDRLTGKHGKVTKQNELEALMGLERDREQRHRLWSAQLKDRQRLQEQIETALIRYRERVLSLHADLSRAREMQSRPPQEQERAQRSPAPAPLQSAFKENATPQKAPTAQDRLAVLRSGIRPRGRDRERDFDR